MRAWLVVGLLLLAACPRGATENERCTKTSDCVAALSCCSGACIDVTKDTRHCGACGEACGTRNAVATCQAGVCRAACTEGFADCNAAASDGCEVDLRADVANCGACGSACVTANATAACTSSQCTVAACQTGFANCDGRAANGCEVSLVTDLMNCGGCGATCSVPNATARCFSSRCAVGTCEAGRADCDGEADGGCEADTRTSTLHCGGCNQPCPTDQSCVLGQCRLLELYVFGGMPMPADVVTNEVLRLQLGQRSFTPVVTASPTGAPPARAFHLAAWDATDTQLLVLGGSGTGGAPVAPDLFALDLSLTPPTWSRPATTGTAPAALTGMAGGWDRANRRWYVFGGSDQAFAGTPTSSLLVFDAATSTWTQPSGSGTTPPARAFAAATFDETSARFVVHGGLGANGVVLGDTWVFDPVTVTWTSAMMSGPGPRVASTFFHGASPPVLFGGGETVNAPQTHFNDVWELDPLTATWTLRATMNGPAPRRWSVGVTVGGLRHLVSGVFDDGATQTLFNDVWALQWPSRTWQQVRSNAPVGAAGVRVGFTAVSREP